MKVTGNSKGWGRETGEDVDSFPVVPPDIHQSVLFEEVKLFLHFIYC